MLAATSMVGRDCMLTGSLEDKVNLSRVVSIVEMVLAGGVEVELEEVVHLAADVGGTARDDLDGGAEVEELSARVAVGDVGAKGRATDSGDLAGDDIDGGLVLARAANLGSRADAEPVQGAGELMVAKGTVSAADNTLSARSQVGGIVAHGGGQRDHREEDSGDLHLVK